MITRVITPRLLLTIRPASLIHHFSTALPKLTNPPHYYSLFPKTLPLGPPPSSPFALSPHTLKLLRQEFLRSQQSVHPDLTADPAQKQHAQNTSAYLNTAYRTLQDPLLRAQYLLRVRGVEAEDEAAGVEDLELLGEVMGAMEEVEELEGAGHGRGRAWKGAWRANEERVENTLRSLEEAFARDELERAKEECVRLRYWVNVRRSLRDVGEGRESEGEV